MGNVFADISMSLDGFIAGQNDEIDPLHDWIYGLKSFHERHGREGGETSRDSEVLDEAFDALGAAIVGRRMYDLVDGWGDNPPFGAPVFVLTHAPREEVVKGDTTFSFVNDTAEGVLERAQAAAGDKGVAVSGGANVIQQFLAAGLLDETRSTWLRCCSARASGCSTGQAPIRSGLRPPG